MIERDPILVAINKTAQFLSWIAIDRNGELWGYEFRPSWSEEEGFWFDYGGGRFEYIDRTSVTGDRESIIKIR